MGFLASVFLPFLLAGLVALTAAVLWRQTLPKPFFFFVLSFVLVLGVHRVVQAAVEIGKFLWPAGGGYFLEYRANPGAFEAVERELTREAFALAFVTAILSYFLLGAVRNSMRQ